MTANYVKSALHLLILAAATAGPASADSDVLNSEATLCRSQLGLLKDRQRVTPEEIARFDAQCACLEDKARSGDPGERQNCAQKNEL